MISLLRSKLINPPKWNKLYRIRDLSAAKGLSYVLVLVPLAGAAKIILSEQLLIDIEIPLNFQILYASAFLSFVAGLVFDMYCPSIIRLNRNYPTFFKDTQVLGVEILSKHAEISSQTDKALDDLVGEMATSLGKSETLKKNPILNNYTAEITKMNMLWHTSETWDNENKYSPAARRSIFLLYGASGLLALYIVLIDAPLRVVAAL